MRNKTHNRLLALKLLLSIAAIIAAMYSLGTTININSLALLIIPFFLVFATICYIPVVRKSWIIADKLSQISVAWYLIPSSAAVSFAVAQGANAQPNSYWPLFGVWFIAVLAVLSWSLFTYLTPEQRTSEHFKHALYKHRMELFIVAGIILFAFFVRFINLATIPAPFEGDEALMALKPRLGIGLTQNMFSGGWIGDSMLYYWALVPFHRVFDAYFAQRLPSVLIGVLTLPILYLFFRQAWGKLIAIAGTLYFAGYHYHVHYSRAGIPNIGVVFIALLSVFLCWRVLEYARRSDFILLGLSLGSVFYFWLGARIVFIIIPLVIGVHCLRHPSFIKKQFGNFVLLILAFLITGLPMLYFWSTFPHGFNDRLNQVGVFSPTWLVQQKSMGKTDWGIARDQLEKSFGLFITPRDNSPHYRAQIALVDKFSLVFFLLGFLLSVINFRKPNHQLLLLLFTGTVILGGTLTFDPHSARLLTTIPAVACWVAIGMASIGRFVRLEGKSLLIGVLACISLLIAYNLFFYFHTYAPSDAYSDFNTRIAQALGKHMQQFPPGTVLFLYGAPNLFTGHPPLVLLTKDYPKNDVLLDGSVVPAPSNQSSPRVFAFVVNRKNELQEIQVACLGGVSHTLKDGLGRELFSSYEFPNESACLPEKLRANN